MDACRSKANQGLSCCDKTGYELVEFEEAVKNDGGCWITLIKVATNAAAAGAGGAAAKKGDPKAKAPSMEESKPIVGRAWVSFADLQKAGAIKTEQRIFLETVAPPVKDTSVEGVEKYVDAEEFSPVFEEPRTYLHLKLSLS